MAKKRVGRYPKAFRRMAVKRLKKCDNIVALSRELGVHRRLLYKWRDQLDPAEVAEESPPQNSRESTLRKEVNQLKRLLADKAVEVDFFKVPCKKSRLDASGAETLARRHLRRSPGSDADARQYDDRADVSIRAGEPGRIYRYLQERTPVEEDMELRSAIQQIALEHRRRYGYRRISAELRRRGMLANHKRVARIVREDKLLAVQPRQFVVTTDSHHELEVYLNLARRVKLTGIDQLSVADITYIRLRAEFVYLAVILDAFSRKVVGWALERTLTSRLARSSECTD